MKSIPQPHNMKLSNNVNEQNNSESLSWQYRYEALQLKHQEQINEILKQKKSEFAQFMETVECEMHRRVLQFQELYDKQSEQIEELQTNYDRVCKDNTLFDILLNERDSKIAALQSNTTRQQCSNELQQLQNENNELQRRLAESEDWKQRFVKLNKDYHLMMTEHSNIQAEMDSYKDAFNAHISSSKRQSKLPILRN